jgi:hypothetical protein
MMEDFSCLLCMLFLLFVVVVFVSCALQREREKRLIIGKGII